MDGMTDGRRTKIDRNNGELKIRKAFPGWVNVHFGLTEHFNWIPFTGFSIRERQAVTVVSNYIYDIVIWSYILMSLQAIIVHCALYLCPKIINIKYACIYVNTQDPHLHFFELLPVKFPGCDQYTRMCFTNI